MASAIFFNCRCRWQRTQWLAEILLRSLTDATGSMCMRFHGLPACEKLIQTNFSAKIFISRGFTCYQMEQAIAHKLPSFLSTINTNTALIFGLLDTFYDEQAQLREVQQILRRLLDSFQKMKSSGISILLVCLERTVAPKERNQLFTTLKNGVDRVYKLDTNEQGKIQLFLESQQTASAVRLIAGGETNYGTDGTDLHQPDRCRTNKLGKVPPRTSQRRSGNI